jgi:ATP-dependent Lhr-like helicase
VIGAGLDQARLQAWFAARHWQAFDFQSEVWTHAQAGRSGLLHAGTGTGKTYAVWFGALLRACAQANRGLTRPLDPTSDSGGSVSRSSLAGADRGRLQVLWITPMRALAADTVSALAQPLADLGLNWSVELRTGDSSARDRARQTRRMPQALVTTPESLMLLLARADAAEVCSGLRAVVVDEWHELLGNKRGVQVQLGLARLRRLAPGLVTWGLSATLGDVEHALEALIPSGDGVCIRAQSDRMPLLDVLLPPKPSRFAWAGHLGASMLPAVVQQLEASATALLFCNTRAQAELWYQMLLEAKPDWAGLIALHHGSLDIEVRRWVETALKQGALRAVVCTSSLDLGVDFAPVERVLQLGSAKGVARLLQRAGRSGHRPGAQPRLTLVPTHALELLEAAAAADAVAQQLIEPRRSPQAPLDVLVQHLVSIALGSGFTPEAMLAEVCQTHAYRAMSSQDWQWALDFVSHGGDSLRAYPQYRRVQPDAHGVWRLTDPQLARRHRMSVGTIVADSSMRVKFLRGAELGTVEEGFIARLKRGDCFLFAGRLLELIRVHEMTAWVRLAKSAKPAVARWNGARMPLSSQLADAVLARLEACAEGRFEGVAMKAVRPLLQLQMSWSRLPGAGHLLIEFMQSRDGHHVFIYPFAGRQANLGLAALLAWRIAQRAPITFSMAVNDYGLELLSPTPLAMTLFDDSALYDPAGLAHDLTQSVNAAELARRHFREIARVAGLVFQGYPGEARTGRALQASAGLFYDVFRQHDPENRLLRQAHAEVLSRELDLERIADTLGRVRQAPVVRVELKRPSPFAFALMVERLRETLSTESLQTRIERMVSVLDAQAQAEVTVGTRAHLRAERQRAG